MTLFAFVSTVHNCDVELDIDDIFDIKKDNKARSTKKVQRKS